MTVSTGNGNVYVFLLNKTHILDKDDNFHISLNSSISLLHHVLMKHTFTALLMYVKTWREAIQEKVGWQIVGSWTQWVEYNCCCRKKTLLEMALPPWTPLLNSFFPFSQASNEFSLQRAHTRTVHCVCVQSEIGIKAVPTRQSSESRCSMWCHNALAVQWICLTTMVNHCKRPIKDPAVLTLQHAPVHFISASPITMKKELFVSWVHSTAGSGDMLPSVAGEWDSPFVCCITFMSFLHWGKYDLWVYFTVKIELIFYYKDLNVFLAQTCSAATFQELKR